MSSGSDHRRERGSAHPPGGRRGVPTLIGTAVLAALAAVAVARAWPGAAGWVGILGVGALILA
ncbi:MAG TPA: hypothetical protein RMF84_02540, partial [Polyangiaceae bacterium LLY-WYZ-14_1]|nr:hypothetical protein [Polyangiaceae bacterium LLY-WYZ-14_1]